MKSYSKEDYRKMLWKNGGGTTTELYRYPINSNFVIRLSCAEVKQDGPFSLYEGYDRYLVITAGEGCFLNLEDQKITLTKDKPFSFAGEVSIHCELIQGPIKDFNVIIDRGWGEAHLKVLTGMKGEIELHCLTDLLFAYNLDDETLLELKNEDIATLYSNYLIIIEIKKRPDFSGPKLI